MNVLSKFAAAICLLPLSFGCGGASADRNAGNEAPQEQERSSSIENGKSGRPRLLYMGHASLRITTPEGKVIYIDPFAGEEKWYEPAADLILVTHSHFDHNQTDKIKNRNAGCQTITWETALKDGKHQSFSLGYAEIEAV